MLKIRFQKSRYDSNGHKVFDLVSIDSRKKRDGNPLKNLGVYTISSKGDKSLEISREETLIQLYRGAQMTKPVKKVLTPLIQEWSQSLVNN